MLSPFTLVTDDDVNCYQHIFNIENYLRLVIRWELRKDSPRDWANKIPPDALKSAERAFEQEASLRYLDVRESGILSYLHLSDLKDILTGPLWPLIRKNWPPLDIVQSEFKKIIASRNKMAHFRPTTQRDLRVVSRFFEDLGEWTAHYKGIQDAARPLRIDKDEVLKGLSEEDNKIVQSALKILRSGTESQIEFFSVDKHIAISMKLTTGSFNPDAFAHFIRCFEKDLTCVRLGKFGDMICSYTPIKLGGEKIKNIITAQFELRNAVIEKLGSDEARDSFKLSIHEGVIPWHIVMPTPF